MADQVQASLPPGPYGGKGPLILAVAWTEASIALILILMRTYTNAFLVKSFKWDYFWGIIALVLGMIAMAMLTVSVASGLGNHIYLLKPQQIVKSIEWSWIGQSLLIQSIGCGKYAIIAFILRIQDRTESKKRIYVTYFLYFIGFSNFAINITEVAMIMTSCSPTAKFWNSELPGSCNNIGRTNHVGYFQGSWAAASDVALAIVPVYVFWDLRVSVKLKIGLCLLMAGGIFAAVAGVLKTVYIKTIIVESDVTYVISPLVIWACTENWLVLILGSLPPLRPLFRQVFHGISVQGISIQSLRRHNRRHGYNQQSDPKNILMHPRASKRIPKDTDSEREILPGGAAILRTTHVQVISNSKSSRDDSKESSTTRERGITF